ncbi:ergothioneine biosynthesis protein EgtB [Natronoglycomyces albus]|uniref:Ergothioneine biosynthesis protein EgtB n=1 Tax=Natronoglycomyces albus TaxID=2811108 RepID=A0A895XPT1_9ACTN|nr:ergothioneine biosynthesis protein EgtB [Natronoglycomyces albus]QSB05115.1 ergothioneine biosynthesis protein EgtB [Natronoglycomyces albus]
MTITTPDALASPDLPLRYKAVRELTEDLAAPLSAEDQSIQSMPDASPTKWHRAHTTWFFETFLLQPHLRDYHVFHPQFGYLFNSYYETVGTPHPRPERGMISRPGIEEVKAYRQHVDAGMERLLTDKPGDDLAALVELGLQHEQQHQELLLMDIKHALWQNPLQPSYADLPPPKPTTAASLSWIEHPGGLIEIGHAGTGFAYDNETPRHKVWCEPFALANRLVTNGEWKAFIEDGGYQRPELWLSEGWATVQEQGWKAPLYWDHTGDEAFTLAGPQAIDPAQPVSHVSYFEADAYATWAGHRLPRESEWECVAAALPTEGAFLNQTRLRPQPAQGKQSPMQMFGDVWEWTASSYLPYPGYQPPKGAIGEYNGKFMVNQHVLRGGSCVTPPHHVRATYRNFFGANARWAFSGVRLAT